MASATTDTENLLETQSELQQQRRSGIGRKVVFTAALAGALLLVGLGFHAMSAASQPASTQGSFVDLFKAPVAKITAEEGHEVAKKYVNAFSTYYTTGEASDILDLTADEMSYQFSGGMPPAGKKKKDEIYGGKGTLIGDTWAPLGSAWIPSNIFSVVDTGLGKVWVTFEAVALFDGKGKVKPDKTSLVQFKGCMWELDLNDDNKVEAMKEWHNPTLAAMGAAMAQVAPHPDKPPPTPEVVISEEDGLDLISKFLSMTAECFGTGDFKPCNEMFADEVAWDWSGGEKGKGSKDDYLKAIWENWGAFSSKFHSVQRGYVVDTVAGVVAFTFDVILVLDARGKVKDTEGAMFFGSNVFELTVNKDKKITVFKAHWDSTDASLLKVAAPALAAMKA